MFKGKGKNQMTILLDTQGIEDQQVSRGMDTCVLPLARVMNMTKNMSVSKQGATTKQETKLCLKKKKKKSYGRDPGREEMDVKDSKMCLQINYVFCKVNTPI